MISRILSFFVCLIGVLLPWRLRVIYAEALGWVIQFFYYLYYGSLNFILRELKKGKEGAGEK